MDSILGVELPLLVKLVIAFVVVLGLIGLATFVFRKFGGERLGVAPARGRQPRLAVIDAAPVDGRRRLVLIRRDGVEHLIMIGGPSDVVIEQNIVRAVPVAPPREAPMARSESSRTDMDAPPPPPRREAPPRPQMREAPVDMAPPPRAPRADLGPRPPRGVEPRRAEAPRESMREPAARPMRPPPPSYAEPEPQMEVHPAPPTADTNLADMAHRLEAALRRPSAVREPAPLAEPAPREPRTPSVQRTPAPADAPPPRAPEGERGAKPAPQASVFDSLEEEMASLLGKPEKKG